MTDLVSIETITEIAQSFWEAFLPDGAELQPGSGPLAAEEIRGRVDIDGSWTGSVELSCSLALARRVASAMFCVEEEALDPIDVRDAVGEIVNVVGGNIKSILPPPTSLSIPVVDEAGPDPGATGIERTGTQLESEVHLSSGGEPVVVRLWRSAGPAVG
jgi:chemotaxis protein CheX